MITILIIYAAISVTFSLGFAAGAWWASRARITEDDCLAVETIERDHGQATVLVLRRAAF